MNRVLTPEDIDKLADEYADKECAMSRHTGKKLKQLHEDKIIEFYDVFGFLIERFCIVEKSKLKELYEDACEDIRDYNGKGVFGVGCADMTMYQRARGMKQMLYRLFGKDTFEEEGK